MSNEIIVTEEGRVTLVLEPEPIFQLVVEDVPDIDLILPPPEEVEVILVYETGPQGPRGATWWTGSGAPGPPEAIQNDLYLDKVSGDMWLRLPSDTTPPSESSYGSMPYGTGPYGG
jgi:hypothetical protein